MACRSSVELKDLALKCQIGTHGPGDTVPEAHWLDLTLWVHHDLVLIAQDGMAHVFDYDPLVVEIERLASDGPFETQEWLMSRIVQACARCPQVDALDIALRKTPVRPGSGSLGVRLCVDEATLLAMRHAG